MPSINRYFHSIIFFLFFHAISSEKSCETKCNDLEHPRCGAWIHSDNNRLASGIYLLEEGFVNFTCMVSSLPRPTSIKWYFEPEYGSTGSTNDRLPVACSSLRTTTECKFNEFGEHRVTSVCLLKINRLEQTGSYFCSGQLEEYTDAESSKIRIYSHGISNISLHDEISTLEYGKIGRIRIRVCANPKPHLVWIHRPSGRTLAAGSSTENETASVLYHELDTSNSAFGPIYQYHYCYVAALIIGRVRAHSYAWTIMVWNNVDSKRFDLPINVVGEPPLPKFANKMISLTISQYLILCLITIFVIS